MKKKTKKSSLRAVWCSMAVFSGVVLAITFWPQGQTSSGARLQATVNQHLRAMASSEWLLKEVPVALTPKLEETCAAERRALLEATSAWCPTNSLGMKVREWLPSWGWGVATRVAGQTVKEVQPVIINGPDLVCLLPERNGAAIRATFFCGKEEQDRVVVIKGYKMPRQILAAFLLHEIGHANNYWREQHKASETEEVEMHQLSVDVLDNYSHGRYRRAVRGIVGRVDLRGGVSYRRVLAGLTKQDLEELDRIVGAQNVGQDVAGCVVVQHLLTVGFETIDQSGGGVPEKVALYSWLNSLHPSVF